MSHLEKREIFEVHIAYVNNQGFYVSNPTLANVKYPIAVDSRNYDGDIQQTLNIADGKMCKAASDLSVRNEWQVRHAWIIRASDGVQIMKKTYGKIADVVVMDEYNVTVINGEGSGIVVEGDPVNIIADEPAEGFVFDKWDGAEELVFTAGDAHSAEATFTMPDRDVMLAATYVQAEPDSEEEETEEPEEEQEGEPEEEAEGE